MFDFIADNHANSFHYGNQDWLETLEPGSWGGFMQTMSLVGSRQFTGQWENGVSGIGMHLNAAFKMVVNIDGTSSAQATTAWAVDATTHSWHVTWDGIDVDYMLDGGDDGNGIALADTSLANAGNLMLGRHENVIGDGLDCYLGQVMIWDTRLSVADTAIFHAGNTIPQAGSLRAWIKCTSDPDKEQKSQTAGTKTGAPTVVADPCDDYFPPVGGGFALYVMEWLGPVMGTLGATLGAGLQYEKVGPLWTHIQNHMGRCFPDMPYDDAGHGHYEHFINYLSRRPVWLV